MPVAKTLDEIRILGYVIKDAAGRLTEVARHRSTIEFFSKRYERYGSNFSYEAVCSHTDLVDTYSELEQYRKRIAFMATNAVFINIQFISHRDKTVYEVWMQDEDEEFHTLSGPTAFDTPEEAIDAAIALQAP
jgi:hypothetical protein